MRFWCLNHLSLFLFEYYCPTPLTPTTTTTTTTVWCTVTLRCEHFDNKWSVTVAISLTYHEKEKATGCKRDNMKEHQPYWLFIKEIKNSSVTAWRQRFSLTRMKITISHKERADKRTGEKERHWGKKKKKKRKKSSHNTKVFKNSLRVFQNLKGLVC